jgi:hypothetical protein
MPLAGAAKGGHAMRTNLPLFAGTIGLLVAWGANADEPGASSPQVESFPLQQVRLLDGPFKAAAERDRQYLHDLEAERLLHSFRVNAGLPAPGEAMGGWEQAEVRGHTMGHYLSACGLTIASCGDEKLKQKADSIVAELAKCQKALGESGYLSAFPESIIDRVETRQRVWAPYYTLHKIMAGLLDMYVHTDNRQALEVVTGMADWCKARCDRLSDEQMQAMLNATEQGGMNELLANLASVTGNADYLALARRFVQQSYNAPLAAKRDELTGQHVNSFIPNMIGTARLYEVGGDEEDRQIADFFWNQVTSARCYCTGGTSNREHWQSPPNQLAHELGDHTQETCCTYNMLKLTRHLFCWQPEARYADYYERALYNSILGTQDPATGMMMYFVTLGSGRWKYYNTPRDSFWCCTGTGMENHAKYGDSIYFHDDEGVFVNLFIPSELNWAERGVRIRQETEFPEVSASSFTVNVATPVEFPLRIRVPGWVDRGVEAKLNGVAIAQSAKASSYLEVKRTWQDGDRVEVSMPMSLTVSVMPDAPTLMAFMVGPLVLAAQLGGEGLTNDMVYTTENWYKFPVDQIAKTAPLLTDDDDPLSLLEPVAGKALTYRTTGQETDVTFVPYHKLFGQRYAVYWHVYRRGSEAHRRAVAEAEATARFRQRVVDEVIVGDSDSERAHGLKGKDTASGSHQGRGWRHATSGGFFSYDMKVRADGPTDLFCTYWGSDSGPRSFEILVDGQLIATEKLAEKRPGEFFDVVYPIPEELTQEKERVTVRFQAFPGQFAGGVFGCCTVQREP